MAIPLLVGSLFRPQAQEAPAVVGPSVVVLASQAGVAATVNAALSVGYGRDRRASKLQLTVVATSKISGTVRLAVELSDFPSGTTVKGAAVVPVTPPTANSALLSPPVAALPYPRGYGDYAFPVTLTQPRNSSAAMQTITILAPKPIGEATEGTELRVAFPVLRGEGPGANAFVAYRIRNLFSGAANLVGSRQAYVTELQAGLSTFSDQSHPLSGYQVLAGDPPTLLGATNWAWDGINEATVLAANLHAQDIDQLKVFYSGLALGLAFAALITLLLELIPAESATGSSEEEAKDGEPDDDQAPAREPAEPADAGSITDAPGSAAPGSGTAH